MIYAVICIFKKFFCACICCHTWKGIEFEYLQHRCRWCNCLSFNFGGAGLHFYLRLTCIVMMKVLCITHLICELTKWQCCILSLSLLNMHKCGRRNYLTGDSFWSIHMKTLKILGGHEKIEGMTKHSNKWLMSINKSAKPPNRRVLY